MRYMRAYQFLFDSPNWIMNLLFSVVCQMIPVVGPIVFLGYQYEVVESLHYSGDKRYPDFNFNRFMNYLTRGIWPFLVQLIVTLPIVFLAMGVMMVVMVGLAATAPQGGNANNPPNPTLPLVVFALLIVGGMIIGFLLMLIVGPMALRAGLSQELALGETWAFTKDFLSRVGKDYVLCQLVAFVATWVLVMAGALAFCVGMYPAIVVAVLGHQHLVYQIYEEYLRRGGSEIPLKIEEATR